MDLNFTEKLADVGDARHKIRHLGWFRGSFERCAEVVGERRGIDYEVDSERLAEAFLDWAEDFSAQKKFSALAPADFAVFSAGQLIKQLIRNDVARARLRSGRVRPDDLGDKFAAIAEFWPEGFLYVNYCLGILEIVMSQDFHGELELKPPAEDLRAWWSFRENTREDPALASGFLDAFLGKEPNWRQPDWAGARPAIVSAIEARSEDGPKLR
jgi:hypothetical protein